MRRDAGSPSAWMAYAHSDLEMARVPASGSVMLESLCFHAQQAVEKSIKAVLLQQGVPFPKIHVVERLIDMLPADIPRSPELLASAQLTEYATISRYPGMEEPVTEEQYREAVRLAEVVVKWAEGILRQGA